MEKKGPPSTGGNRGPSVGNGEAPNSERPHAQPSMVAWGKLAPCQGSPPVKVARSDNTVAQNNKTPVELAHTSFPGFRALP
jgi:hypothetical protein